MIVTRNRARDPAHAKCYSFPKSFVVSGRITQLMNPAISVIVATRNRPEHIALCIASILANTETEFELLVVDQSDTNASREVVEKLGPDSRLRLIESDTRGLSASRSAGGSSEGRYRVAQQAARGQLLIDP